MDKIKHLLALFCATLAAACSGGQPAQEGPAPAKTAGAEAPAPIALRVGTNAEFAPFEYQGEGGALIGFDVDLLNAMAKEGNFTVSWKDQPWEGLIPGLQNDEFDVVIAAMTITPERSEVVDFTDPYFEIRQVALVPQESSFKSIDDLKKAGKIGVCTGQTGDLVAQKLFGATNPRIARYESIPLVLKELEQKGVDVVLADGDVIRKYVKDHPEATFQILDMPPEIEPESYGIAVRKGQTEILDRLNQSLKAVRQSGELDKIKAKHFGV